MWLEPYRGIITKIHCHCQQVKWWQIQYWKNRLVPVEPAPFNWSHGSLFSSRLLHHFIHCFKHQFILTVLLNILCCTFTLSSRVNYNYICMTRWKGFWQSIQWENAHYSLSVIGSDYIQHCLSRLGIVGHLSLNSMHVQSFINPRRACAARVTVLGLCPSVCLSVTTFSAARRN